MLCRYCQQELPPNLIWEGIHDECLIEEKKQNKDILTEDEQRELEIYFNMLYHPMHYNIKNLPLAAKQALLDRVEKMLAEHSFEYASAKQSLEQIQDYVDTPGVSQELIAFKDVTHNLDEFRNEEFASTFTELYGYIYGETKDPT